MHNHQEAFEAELTVAGRGTGEFKGTRVKIESDY